VIYISVTNAMPGFDPRPNYVEFLADKGALDRFFSKYFTLPISLSFQNFSIFIHSSIHPSIYHQHNIIL